MRFQTTTVTLLTLASGVCLTTTPRLAYAQPGTVLSHQKISDTQGNFGGGRDERAVQEEVQVIRAISLVDQHLARGIGPFLGQRSDLLGLLAR